MVTSTAALRTLRKSASHLNSAISVIVLSTIIGCGEPTGADRPVTTISVQDANYSLVAGTPGGLAAFLLRISNPNNRPLEIGFACPTRLKRDLGQGKGYSDVDNPECPASLQGTPPTFIIKPRSDTTVRESIFIASDRLALNAVYVLDINVYIKGSGYAFVTTTPFVFLP